jgi:hypothetical protein
MTAEGHQPSLRLGDREGSTAVVRKVRRMSAIGTFRTFADAQTRAEFEG